MKELVEVKEYQFIYCDSQANNRPHDSESEEKAVYVKEPVFDELKTLIKKFKKVKGIADVQDFVSLGYRQDYGYTITFKNYVGLIQLRDGTQFNILPKIALDKDDHNEKTKETFLYMLCSMKKFPLKSFNTAALKATRMNLYEFFIRMYLNEVLNLVKKGIRSSYVGEEDNLRYFRGKLLIAQHLRYNLAHQERFYVAYEDFNINRPENKLIKTTLLELQRLTTDATNALNIKQLLNIFDSVDVSTNFKKDFQKVLKNRETKDYDNLMLWTKIFLMDHNTFSPFGGTKTAKAFLFPMEQVFEAYVAKQIKKIFTSAQGWSVSCQKKIHSLSEDPKMFWLKPDIVLTLNPKQVTVIMDTKWKQLLPNKDKNYGIKPADMYQMYAYSKIYGAKHIWLLYPYTKEMREYESKIYFRTKDNTIIHIFFVDTAQDKVKENLEKLKKAVDKDI